MLIDFHCHFPSPDALVCTAEPSSSASALPAKTPSCLMRFEGLLPDRWTEQKQEQLTTLLLTDSSIHMGEIGLDKRFINAVPMQKQADILQSKLSFAFTHGRCVSLHCVHATGLMLEILSRLSYRPFSVLWHGFTGSAETAARLQALGVIISIGSRFTGSISDIVKSNPFTVPETDYEGTDADEHQGLLRAQYNRFSTELGIPMSELESGCRAVFDIFSTES